MSLNSSAAGFHLDKSAGQLPRCYAMLVIEKMSCLATAPRMAANTGQYIFPSTYKKHKWVRSYMKEMDESDGLRWTGQR